MVVVVGGEHLERVDDWLVKLRIRCSGGGASEARSSWVTVASVSRWTR